MGKGYVMVAQNDPRVRFLGAVAQVFTVTVDCAQSLAQMIAAGRYDWVNQHITQRHFPIRGSGVATRTLHLVHLNRAASIAEVEQELERRGLTPTPIEDLLALGAAYPYLQPQFPIVALGSRWRDFEWHWRVPVLSCGSVHGRDLDLIQVGDAWGGHCRFLAVSKPA